MTTCHLSCTAQGEQGSLVSASFNSYISLRHGHSYRRTNLTIPPLLFCSRCPIGATSIKVHYKATTFPGNRSLKKCLYQKLLVVFFLRQMWQIHGFALMMEVGGCSCSTQVWAPHCCSGWRVMLGAGDAPCCAVLPQRGVQNARCGVAEKQGRAESWAFLISSFLPSFPQAPWSRHWHPPLNPRS